MLSHKFTSTDVDGVFSSDPNTVKDAKLLKKVSYDEMIEAATSGAKVLHNRAVSLAKKYKLRLNIRNARGNNTGTIITEENNIEERYTAKILAVKNNLAKITIVGEHMYSNLDYIWKIYNLAKENDVIIYMLSFNEISINLIVEENKTDEFTRLLHNGLIEI